MAAVHGDGQRFQNLPKVVVELTKGKDKTPLWKKVFKRKKNGEKKRQDEGPEELQMDRKSLLKKDQHKPNNLSTSTETMDTELTKILSTSSGGIHKNYYQATSVSIPTTPEPPLKKNRQNGPIQIAWPDSNPAGLSINIGPIVRQLAKLGDIPVAIFSINGATRGGKSFLLNQAVKYLKFGKSHPNDWIDQDLEISFDWSFRMESVTEGIDIWPEPFILESEDGKKVGLILMDNQGLEDVHTTTHVAYKLFCLSNLLSSCFTCCDTQAYTKNYLDSLHTFMEFSKSVEHDGRTATERNENLDYTFGKLILLFRDFRFVKDFPCDSGCSFYHKDGSEERCLYNQIFNKDADKVSQVVRDKRTALLKFYDDIIVSTMIGPGNKEPNMTERLRSTEWDPDYTSGVIKFVEKVFSYKFMVQAVKKISGNVVSAQVLTKYVKNWAKIITEKSYHISDITELEASRNLYYNRKIEESMKLYVATMDDYKFSLKNGDIGEILVQAIKTIETEFWTNCEYGDWRGFYMEKMQNKISVYSNEQSMYLHFAINEKRKKGKLMSKFAGVGGPVIMTVGTVVASVSAGSSGAVLVSGILLASGGGLIFLCGAAFFGYFVWMDRKERSAVRQISSKVDQKFGRKSHFNFKERIRQMKNSRRKSKSRKAIKLVKLCC